MYKKSGIWSKLFGFVYSLEEHRPVDNEGQTSAHSTPDLGSLTEFHQLILLRLLRPDRFPSTARRYVTRHLTSVTSHPSSIGSILGSKERLLGVLVLLPPTPAFGNQQFPGSLKMKTRPVDVLRGIAQVRIKLHNCDNTSNSKTLYPLCCSNPWWSSLPPWFLVSLILSCLLHVVLHLLSVDIVYCVVI